MGEADSQPGDNLKGLWGGRWMGESDRDAQVLISTAAHPVREPGQVPVWRVGGFIWAATASRDLRS